MTKKIYFPGLNGLRAIAALAVIITHTELFKAKWGLNTIYYLDGIQKMGGLAVDLFFVLSGFLITYLILVDHEFGRFSIKSFYLKRVYRIWPLYFLIVLVAFIVLPLINYCPIPGLSYKVDYLERLILFLTFLPNVSKAFFDFTPYAGMAWSIGVEEQFYIIWPWIIVFSKNTIRSIFGLFCLLIISKFLFIVFKEQLGVGTYSSMGSLLAMTRIEIMCVGGMGAYFLYYNEKLIEFVYSRVVQGISYASIPVLVFFCPPLIDDAIHLIISVPFMIIILNVSSNTASLITLENKALNYLGKVSYGIYMYHMVIIGGIISVVKNLGWEFEFFSLANLCFYLIIIGGTTALAAVSYRWFELPFLRIKGKLDK